MKDKTTFSNVPEYIALQPPAVRKGLELLRKTIRRAAPEAEETISYNMPAYRQYGVLVYFAATRTHYGFYPTSSPMEAFREKLTQYKTSRGSICFPLSQPIPVKLVTQIVRWRVRDDQEREAAKPGKNRRGPAAPFPE